MGPEKLVTGFLKGKPLVNSNGFRRLIGKNVPTPKLEISKPLAPIVDVDMDGDLYRDIRPAYSDPLPSADEDINTLNEDYVRDDQDVNSKEENMAKPELFTEVMNKQIFKPLQTPLSPKALHYKSLTDLWHVDPLLSSLDPKLGFGKI